MKMFFGWFSLCLLLCFCSLLYAQERKIVATNGNIIQPSFIQIGTSAWGAGGAYVSRHGLSAASFLNPAALRDSSFSVYVEAGKKLNADYIGLDGNNQFVLPAFVSLSIPLNHSVVSVGYVNTYSLKIGDEAKISPPIDVILDGTGVLIWPALTSKLSTLYGAFKFILNDNFSFGVTAIANYLTDKEDIAIVKAKATGHGYGVIAGTLLSISSSVSMGLGFKYNHKIEGDVEYSPETIPDPNYDSDRGASSVFNISDSARFQTKFPWSLQAGLTYAPTNSILISAMVDYQRWSFQLDELENKLQLHFGVDYQLSNIFGFSIGGFTMNNPIQGYFENHLDQNFLTAGISARILKQLEFSASILDAHLLTDSDFQQTYIMAGLQYAVGE